MSRKQTVRAGIFRDAPSARRAIEAARAQGFDRVHVVCEDESLRKELASVIARDDRLLERSPGALAAVLGLVGVCVGLVLGLVAAWFLSVRGIKPTIGVFIVPGAFAIVGGFVGAMASRGFTHEEQDFYDQEVEEGEILVAIEAETPARIVTAERILRGEGVAPVALPEG